MKHPIRRRLRIRPRDERGVALMTVMLVMALVSALTLTICVIATNNLVSARLAQQAGAAVNASDAGVAQAITYLRDKGVADINCSPSCASNPWGNSTNPATVNVGGKAGQSYKVWIETIVPYPANKTGLYRIHSTGVAGGPAGRSVTVDVSIAQIPFTFGLVAATVDANGSNDIHQESVFATGCVGNRSKIHLDTSKLDVAYGIPLAVHSAGVGCDSSRGPGHPCDSSYKYDQDNAGGDLSVAAGASCYNKARAEFGSQPQFDDPSSVAFNYPTSSYMDAATLASKFGAKRPPFTQAQLDQFKAIARSNGTYYTSASGFTAPSGPNALMYFDLTATDPGGKVDLNKLAVAPWSRDPNPDPAHCPSQSLMVIIEGGDADMNANSKLAAAVFLVSDGSYGDIDKMNGNGTFIGSLYANNMNILGNIHLWMDKCFIDNVPPALTTLSTSNYREVDR